MDSNPIFSIDDENPLGSFQREQMTKKPKKRKPILLIIGIIILILGIMTAVLAARIWDPSWNPFRPSPDEILFKAFYNTDNLETIHQEGEINLSLSYSGEPPVMISLSAESDVDSRDEEYKVDSLFEVNLISGTTKMFLDGALKIIKEDLYFKLDTIPFPLTLGAAMFGVDLESIRGKWISICPDELGFFTSLKSLALENEGDIDETTYDLLSEYPLFEVKEELKDEEMGGIKMYHYLLVFNKDNLKKFLEEYTQLMRENGLYSSEDEEASLEMVEALDDFLEEFGEINADVFIGKKDLLIYQIKGSKLIESSSFDSVGDSLMNGYGNKLSDLESNYPSFSLEDNPSFDLEAELFWNFKYSNFNEDLNIQAPVESISIMEVMIDLIQGLDSEDNPYTSWLMNQSAQQVKDVEIISFLNQLRTLAYLIYVDEASYDCLCNKGRINLSGNYEELERIDGDVLNRGSKVICYSAENEYCIEAGLIAEEGIFYCADASGFVDRVEGSSCAKDNMKCRK